MGKHSTTTIKQVLLVILKEQTSHGLSINIVTWVGSLKTEIRIELVQTELFLYNRGLTKLLGRISYTFMNPQVLC